MSKKKRKPQKAPAPFEDRLQRCWDRKDWATFVTLYMRTPREKAEAAPAGRFFGAALYNCMTTALFTERNIAGACTAAEIILKEKSSKVLRNCARTVFDFRRLRDEGFAPLEALERGGRMPPAYDRLRRGMESLVKEKLKKKKSGSGALLE